MWVKTEYRHINYIKNFSLALYFKKLFRMGKASACTLPSGCLHRGNNHPQNSRCPQPYRTKTKVDGTGTIAWRCGNCRINLFKLRITLCTVALNKLRHRAFANTESIIAIQAVCASHIGCFALQNRPYCNLVWQPVQHGLQQVASWFDISNQHRHLKQPGWWHKQTGINVRFKICPKLIAAIMGQSAGRNARKKAMRQGRHITLCVKRHMILAGVRQCCRTQQFMKPHHGTYLLFFLSSNFGIFSDCPSFNLAVPSMPL